MTALVYGIVRSADAGWSDAVTVAAVAVGRRCCWRSFVAIERRAAQPIMPLRLFAHRERSGAYAARLLFLGAMVPFWFFTTQYLQRSRATTRSRPGSRSCRPPSSTSRPPWRSPKLTRRYGNADVLVGGLLVGVAGMAWLGRLAADTPYLTGIALPMVLIGAGQGGVPRPADRRRHRRRRRRATPAPPSRRNQRRPPARRLARARPSSSPSSPPRTPPTSKARRCSPTASRRR